MWVEYDIEALKRNFLEVFAAIEENSHGSYRIVFNLARHEEGDYFVDLEMSSFHKPALYETPYHDLLTAPITYTFPIGGITDELLLFENPTDAL
jgi:hypothetical protein